MKRLAKVWMAGMVAAAMAAPVWAQSGGEATYKSKCAMCHGQDGLASTPMAKAMQVPSVKSAGFEKKSEAELIAITKNGKGKMPSYNGKLSDAQIKDVVAYLRTLAKK